MRNARLRRLELFLEHPKIRRHGRVTHERDEGRHLAHFRHHLLRLRAEQEGRPLHGRVLILGTFQDHHILATVDGTGGALWAGWDGSKVHFEVRIVVLVDIHHPGAVDDHGVGPFGVTGVGCDAAAQQVRRHAALVIQILEHGEGCNTFRTIDITGRGCDSLICDFTAHGVEDGGGRPEIRAALGITVSGFGRGSVNCTGYIRKFLHGGGRSGNSGRFKDIFVPEQDLGVRIERQAIVMTFPEVGGKRTGEGILDDVLEAGHVAI